MGRELRADREVSGLGAELLTRRRAKHQICGTDKANDSAVRRHLILRYGGSERVAIGTKAAPGPLYGCARDCWAALAIAQAHYETRMLRRTA